MASIQEQVYEIIQRKLSVNPEQITPEASFTEDLGADSLDTVELVMDLEEQFNITIPEEDQEKLRTVQDAIDYLGGSRPDIIFIDYEMSGIDDGLEALAEITGEDVTLESLVGAQVLILDEARGRSLLGLDSSIGTRWPAHATATGKVLNAFSAAPMPEPPGGLQPITDHTITSWNRWTAALSRVREQGYATNIEEPITKYSCACVPVTTGCPRTGSRKCPILLPCSRSIGGIPTHPAATAPTARNISGIVITLGDSCI